MKDQDTMMEEVSAFLVEAEREKRGWLLRLAFPCLPQVHDAEDAVQESFLKAYEKRDSFFQEGSGDGGGKMAAWLQCIVRHTAIDMARSNQRRETMEYASDVSEMEGLFVTQEPGPEQLLEQEEDRNVLLQAMAKLTAPQRRVVRLSYWEGLMVEEIARGLQMERNTVKSHLKRARKQLV